MVWARYLKKHDVLRAGFAVDAGRTHLLEISAAGGALHAQAGLIGFTFFDASGRAMPAPYPGMLQSATVPAYLYLSTLERDSRLRFTAPPGAAGVAIALRPWKCATLMISQGPVLYGVGGQAMPSRPELIARAKPAHAVRSLARSARERLVSVWNALHKSRTRSSTTFSCEGGQLYRFSVPLRVRGVAEGNDAVLTLSFADASGAPVAERVRGFSAAKPQGSYLYLRRGNAEEAFDPRIVFRAPAHAKTGTARLSSASASLSVRGRAVVAPVTWDELRNTDSHNASHSEARALLVEARFRGDYEFSLALARRLDALDRTHASAHAVRQLEGTAQVLSVEWLPSVLRRRRLPDESSGAWRVAHLFKGIWPEEFNGGAIRSWNIAKHQAQLGWAPLACLPLRNTGDERDGVATDERDGVSVASLRFAAFDRSKMPITLVLDLEATLHAGSIEQHGCNIVHAASGFRGFDNALKGLAIARHLRVPFVYEVRSFHEQSWATPEQDADHAPLTRARARQEERCMAAADAVVTISQAMVEELVRRGVTREKIFLVPNAVEESFFEIPAPGELDALRERYDLRGCEIAGSISNLSAREGHADLIAAFAVLAPQRPNLRCLLIGEGNQSAALREQVRKLGLEGRVIFAGEIDHADIRKYYRLIDVFVVPRRADYASNFVTPMKALEALALARPLVMSDLPVSRELVGEEARGILARAGDVDDLARALNRLLSDKALAQRLGEAGSAWVRRERVWASTISRYEAAYAYARARVAN